MALVRSMKRKQSIAIGDKIVLHLSEIRPGRVKLLIEAPADYRIAPLPDGTTAANVKPQRG